MTEGDAPIGLSELLAEIGDENIEFQVLNNDTHSLTCRPTGSHDTITFRTAPGNANAMAAGRKRAFVVWLDEAEAQRAATSLRSRRVGAGATHDTKQQGAET